MKRIVLVLCVFFFPIGLYAQANAGGAVEHMKLLSAQDDALSKKYMSYMSEIAHGGRARKMEKRRIDLINSINETLRDCGRIKPFGGDASLRDAYRDYYFILLSIFKEDYHKIIDMEEVAERSYDAMEAYLLTMEKADEKLDAADEALRTAYEAFAAKNNVTLVQTAQSKLSRKLAKAARANAYVHQVYLILFKSTVQETLLMESIEKKDVSSIEQYRSSILRYSEEGLSRLDTVKAYFGDGSLTNACRKVLEFQKAEAENKIGTYADFLMKETEFNKTKKAFEAKKSAATKADVDAFNASVTAYNNAINDFNKLNTELNNARAKVMTHWELTRKRFLDHHVPH